ncbi:MAG: hypothetical protein ACYS8W_17300 [Planctomycetota bacterium]|jgi:hypothetical protein
MNLPFRKNNTLKNILYKFINRFFCEAGLLKTGATYLWRGFLLLLIAIIIIAIWLGFAFFSLAGIMLFVFLYMTDFEDGPCELHDVFIEDEICIWCGHPRGNIQNDIVKIAIKHPGRLITKPTLVVKGMFDGLRLLGKGAALIAIFFLVIAVKAKSICEIFSSDGSCL